MNSSKDMMDAIHILIVEDNLGDVRFIRKAIEKWTLQTEIHVVGDGEEAIDFLYQRGKYGAAPRPRLILLDLNMPIMDGREVLSNIKSHPALKRIPVIVLTTSSEHRDISGSYDLHANSFITKPLNHHDFQSILGQIESFWFSVAKIPLE